MTKKKYYECECCKVKAFDHFPEEWLFVNCIDLRIGFYNTNDKFDLMRKYRKETLVEEFITFCSFECFSDYFKDILLKMGINEQNRKNPSFR